LSNLSELLPSGGAQNVVDFVASGTLPNGQAVILNSNGTVTAVAGSGSAEDIPSGSEVTFLSSNTAEINTSFDPNNANKFIVAYANLGSTRRGSCSVGTVSGTSISFGAEQVFESSQIAVVSAAFDPNAANIFIVAYKLSSATAGKSLVGTVSGTSISYGSATNFIGSNFDNFCGVSFDPNTSGKFVIAYSNSSGKAKIGTRSGTSLSYGSETTFSSSTTYFASVAYDLNTANKLVVVYQNTGNSDYGHAIVGSVSGTSISYGSSYAFNSVNTKESSTQFEPNTANTFVTAYRNDTSPEKGSAIAGVVSGTSISFGTQVNFSTTEIEYPSLAFDSTLSNKLIVGYSDKGSSSHAKVSTGSLSGNALTFASPVSIKSAASYYTSVAFNPSASGSFVINYSSSNTGLSITGKINSLSTNLTSTNLMGISAEAIASGATGKVNVLGGLNEGQSSLTPASIYYVQGNGSISTVATAPAQKIGQAISSTKLNLVDL